MSASEQQSVKCPAAKWRKVQNNSGPMPKVRHGHKAVMVKDLIIIFGGGNSGLYDELHVFNPGTQQWFIPAVRGDLPPALAAHGMVSDGGTKVILYGGMLEYGRYGSEMYELQASRWEWKKMKVKTQTNEEPPVPRIGHSFTYHKSDVYMFGGLANESNDPKNNIVRYLDDLHVLHLTAGNQSAVWESPAVLGEPPSPRESHTANICTVKQKDGIEATFLVIYGGMDGTRLGDVHMLKLGAKLIWVRPNLKGNGPPPRSLHTAEVMGNRLYVFGGWTPLVSDELKREEQWNVSGDLLCLNLETFKWEDAMAGASGEELCPPPRAGHCSASVHSRIYIWSGRDGYKKVGNNQVCLRDLWCLETGRPVAPSVIQLVQATQDGLDVCWGAVPTAEAYLLQIKRYDLPAHDRPIIKKHEPTHKIIKLVSNKAGTSTVRLDNTAGAGEQVAVSGSSAGKGTVKIIQKALHPVPSAASSPTTAKIISVVRSPQGGGSLTPVQRPKSQQALPPGTQIVKIAGSQQLIRLPPPPNLPGITTIASLRNQQQTGASTATTPSLPTSIVTPLPGKEQPTSSGSLLKLTTVTSAADRANSSTGDVECSQVRAAGIATKDNAGNVPDIMELQEDCDDETPGSQMKWPWRDVAVIKGTSAMILHYHVPVTGPEDGAEVKNGVVKLAAGQAYKLRVAAINTCGRGKWSPISAFKTTLPNYPSPPVGVKILRHGEGAHLSWEPPLIPNGTIFEYSVYMGVKSSVKVNSKGSEYKMDRQLTFSRVFFGTTSMCLVPPKSLCTAYVDHNANDHGKPSVTFRLAAKNCFGYGSAVQVRWLQEPNSITSDRRTVTVSLDTANQETTTTSQSSESGAPPPKALKLTSASIDKSGRIILKTPTSNAPSSAPLPETLKREHDDKQQE